MDGWGGGLLDTGSGGRGVLDTGSPDWRLSQIGSSTDCEVRQIGDIPTKGQIGD